MNEKMIADWNAAVQPEDTVYILGDVAFMSGYDAAQIVKRLHGTKILVAGNHDRKTLKDVHFRNCFASIHDYLEITHEKTLVVMSHYPFLEWNQMHRGSVMLYWHLHGGATGQEQYRMQDVGVDASGSVVRLLDHVVAAALTREIKRHHWPVEAIVIKDQLIDNRIMLSDLLAQAVARGVQLGRGQRPYTAGPWAEAQDILAETPDVVRHRDSVMGILALAMALAADHNE